jgi:pyruvate/2-oxoglutarate/acetoin dehydrogenase E1 component
LIDEFGPKRVIDTPLSENGLLGTAVGMAMRGERPVPEIQFMGFFYPAFGQFMYTMAKMKKRSGGSIDVPITVRMPYGGGIKASEYHSESTESFLVHTPGVRVICPSSPYDTQGLLSASIRHPDPVIFLEPKSIYRTGRQAVPDEQYTVPLDDARIIQEGGDVTVISWGAMVQEAIQMIDQVDANVELIDLRTLNPLDVETILKSVRKTGRCVIVHEARRTLGVGSEISALISENALDHLLAPIARATGYDVHFPGRQIESEYLPDSARTKHAVEAVMNYEF